MTHIMTKLSQLLNKSSVRFSIRELNHVHGNEAGQEQRLGNACVNAHVRHTGLKYGRPSSLTRKYLQSQQQLLLDYTELLFPSTTELSSVKNAIESHPEPTPAPIFNN